MDLLITKSNSGYEKVFPNTYMLGIIDKDTGQSLLDILSNFNCYFLTYNGSRESTRNLVPPSIRKKGLWVTYILFDGTTIIEYYNSDAIDNKSWGDTNNWIKASNFLVGDISISSNGNWVVQGQDTGVTAQGEKGTTPLLRIQNNKLATSYDKGFTWEVLLDTPIVTLFTVIGNKLHMSKDLGTTWSVVSEELAYKFRVQDNVLQMSNDLGKTWETISDLLAPKFRNHDNKLLLSMDLGTTWLDISEELSYRLRLENNKFLISKDLGNSWEDISDEVIHKFRVFGNKLQMSTDLGQTWEDLSGYISASFRFIEDNTFSENIGKFQISRDEGTTWEDLSEALTTRMYIAGTVESVEALPSNVSIGTIYQVGPLYDEGLQHFDLYLYSQTGWHYNGRFAGVNVGVSTVITDDSKDDEVASAKATKTYIDNKINNYIFDGGSASSVYASYQEGEGFDCGGA